MKKFLHDITKISLLFFLLLISGCFLDQKEPVDISFSDVTNSFTHSMSDFYLKNIQLLNIKGSDYHVVCSTQGGNSDITIRGSIDLSGQDDDTVSGNNFQRDLLFDFYYKDKNKIDGNNIQGNLLSKKVGEEYFIKLSNGVVNFGTGNFEGKFIKLLIDSLGDKWINYDPKFSKKIEDIYEEYLEILGLFGHPDLFTTGDQVSYEGNIAFKTNKGTLILRENNTVELKFEDLEGEYDGEKYYMKGNISGKSGKILVAKDKNFVDYIEISREKKKLNLNRHISNITDFQKNRELDLNIVDFWQNSTWPLKYNIIGTLQISPKLIYGSDLENEIKININCTNEKKSASGDLSLSKPDSFLLLDQILGDSFSLKSILGNTNFN